MSFSMNDNSVTCISVYSKENQIALQETVKVTEEKKRKERKQLLTLILAKN